jgi:putative peptidoglycan lipid II flippase
MVELASTQILLGVVLVLANRVEGGVVAYQAAYSYYLLPHALFALPVATALFPALARSVLHHDHDAYAEHADQGLRAIAYVILPAAAALTALGPLLARTLLVGHVHNGGVQMVGRTITAFGPGLFGYGLFVFAGRLCYARRNTRLPALCNIGVVAGTSAAMVVVALLVPRVDEVPGLAWAQSAGYTLGAVVLLGLAVQRLPAGGRQRALPTIAKCLGAAVVSAAAMALIAGASRWQGRAGGVAGLATSGLAGLAIYVALVALAGGPRPRTFVRLLRGGATP